MNRYSFETSFDYLPQTPQEAHRMLHRAYWHLRNQEKDRAPSETLDARNILVLACGRVLKTFPEVA